ncbi:MAG: hypothetical protein IJC43_05545 [Clostridia bacterium]|nr:hypothetical protein [Clostridia bacterium]
MVRRVTMAVLLLLLLTLPPPTALAAEEDLALLYEGLFESFGGDAFLEQIPPEADEVLPRSTILNPRTMMEALSFRNLLNIASGGLYRIIRDALAGFSRLLLVVLLAVLSNALADALKADYAASAVRITAVLVTSLASWEILVDSFESCRQAIESAGLLLGGLLPLQAAAAAAAGKSLTALLLPTSVSGGIALFAGLNSGVFLPLLQVYFALAMAAAVSGSASLKSLGKVFYKSMVYFLCFATTMMSGALSLQKIVGASADTLAADAAKLALGSAIPVVGSILTDALGTVLGAITALRGAIGVAGIVVLLTLMLPMAVRVLLQTTLCRLAAALSTLFGEDAVTEFLDSVASLWGMLAALVITQGVYFIIATAVMTV